MILTENNFPFKKYSRIISLVPSQTELLYYLGLDDEVIGITKFCVHPANWFQKKTRVGGTKNINLKTIFDLNPDLVIANKEENVKDQIEAIADQCDVWVSDVNNLSEALQMINDVSQLTGTFEKAQQLAHLIQNGFDELKNKSNSSSPIKSAYFIWQEPYMVVAGNTFINEMMKYCGLVNIFQNSDRYPRIELEELIKKDCELVLLSSEPYPFTEKHKDFFQKKLPGKRILLVDGEMFSWYGSRLLKAADYFNKLNLQTNSSD